MNVLTMEQLIASAQHEINIIKHLATKVLPGTLDWRPTPKQRSILELMQYLSNAAWVSAKAVLEGNAGAFQSMEGLMKETTPENFAEKMDANAAELKSLLAQLDEAELEKEVDLFNTGFAQKKSSALLELVLKGLTAYRMQFFLYIKASGNHEIGTSNAWMGTDPKPKS